MSKTERRVSYPQPNENVVMSAVNMVRVVKLLLYDFGYLAYYKQAQNETNPIKSF